MSPRRTAVTVLSSALAVGALTACEAPTPGVTLVSEGKRIRTEATIFCRDGQSVEKRNCASAKHGPRVLSVRQGALVGVDVDRTLAKHGWYLVDVDAKQRTPVQNTHYFTFPADFGNRPAKGVITLEVRSVDHVAENAKDTGTWVVQLLQR